MLAISNRINAEINISLSFFSLRAVCLYGGNFGFFTATKSFDCSLLMVEFACGWTRGRGANNSTSNRVWIRSSVGDAVNDSVAHNFA